MLKQSKKTTSRIIWGIGFILTILAAVLIYACFIHSASEKEFEFVFDGWLYNQEDQKRATAALGKAGLFDYRWEKGRLSVPKSQKSQYEATLTDVAAFPKAPSDVKWESLNAMGQFESESKTRYRELLACAKQLEQTFEYYEKQIQYATVGVRLRREQIGLTVKNITTASIGICTQENETLTPELLSAITIAAKHQLGISNNQDISILDFRAGRAYLGTEDAVSNLENALLAEEQNRQEVYWKNKFLDALAPISGVRVSTTVQLEPLERPQSEPSVRAIVVAPTDENGRVDQRSAAYIGFPRSGNGTFYFASPNSNSAATDSPTTIPGDETASLSTDSAPADASDSNEIANNRSRTESNSASFFADGRLVPLTPINPPSFETPASNDPSPTFSTKIQSVSINIDVPESYIDRLARRASRTSASSETTDSENDSSAESDAASDETNLADDSSTRESLKNAIRQDVEELVATLLRPAWNAEANDSNQWIRVGFFSDEPTLSEEKSDSESVVAVLKPILPVEEWAKKFNDYRKQNDWLTRLILPVVLGFVLLFILTKSLKKRRRSESFDPAAKRPETVSVQKDSFGSPSKNAETARYSRSPRDFNGDSETFPQTIGGGSDQYLRIDSPEKKRRADVLNELYQDDADDEIEDELALSSHLTAGDSYDSMQKEVNELISRNPEQAAQIIRHWIRTGT